MSVHFLLLLFQDAAESIPLTNINAPLSVEQAYAYSVKTIQRMIKGVDRMYGIGPAKNGVQGSIRSSQHSSS